MPRERIRLPPVPDRPVLSDPNHRTEHLFVLTGSSKGHPRVACVPWRMEGGSPLAVSGCRRSGDFFFFGELLARLLCFLSRGCLVTRVGCGGRRFGRSGMPVSGNAAQSRTLPVGTSNSRSKVRPCFSHLTIAYCRSVRWRGQEASDSGDLHHGYYQLEVSQTAGRCRNCPSRKYTSVAPSRPWSYESMPVYRVLKARDRRKVQVVGRLATLIGFCVLYVSLRLIEASRKHVRTDCRRLQLL
jgi:hypothetical protein